ncbi:Ger(x)C family spore germination protein [Caldalkalibacillus salinus]|uniref:Ger(x)C family spore germination protein n=1 Tax=Caldalkalibacillus salinus TaxID=2803787 RepID=UPI001922975B|nr:Ger(x)C family spore germination protein [Caldalkalibacillus salinus]
MNVYLTRSAYKRIASLLCLTALIMFLSGCWSNHDVNKLTVINAMGIDRTEDGQYEITIFTIVPDALYHSQISDGDSQEKKPYIVASSQGASIYDALDKLSTVFAKRKYFGHLQVIVIGNTVAENNIEPILDILRRHDEFRLNTRMLFTQGRARDILTTVPMLENSLGAEIFTITEYSRLTTNPVVRDAAKFAHALSNDTMDPISGQISLTTEDNTDIVQLSRETEDIKKDNHPNEEALDRNMESVGLNLGGSAVFKDNRLIGWLDQDETRALAWIAGDIDKAVLTTPCSNSDEGTLTIEVSEVRTEKKPIYHSNGLEMEVNITFEGNIRDITCPGEVLTTERLADLRQQIEQDVEREITAVLQKVQKEWQADPFGFGRSIYQHDPEVWRELEPHWREGLLKELRVHLNIDANIDEIGLIYDPSKANESR